MSGAAVRRSRSATVFGEARRSAVRLVERVDGQRWPSAKWRNDPLGFANKILGVKLWEFQERFILAIRDHRHVAVAGGRKLGKDFAVAVAALWWYASWPRAKVFLLAPTSTQLDEIAFLEIRQIMAESGRCLDCKLADDAALDRGQDPGPRPCPHSALLTGEVGLKARTGIRAPDFRQIFGKTATSGGRLRGFSGAKVLAIEDEASDITDELDAAVVGNLASKGCHRVIISQPMKTYGFFYRAFHEEATLYHTIQQSSEETPNAIEDREVFPGLASREWLKDRELAWGKDSPLWAANVEGKFPKAAQGQLFTLEAMKLATHPDRLVKANGSGRLQLGIDVARAETGDEAGFAPRRGDIVHEVHLERGLAPEGLLERALELLKKYRQPGDVLDEQRPIVVLDRDGAEGARAYDVFSAYLQRDQETAQAFVLIGFQGGQPPGDGMKDRYRWNRDLLYAGLVEWLKRGGCLPEHLKLQGDLVAMRWEAVELGKSTLERKELVKQRLGRSPDSGDAVALSTWRIPGLFTPASLGPPQAAPIVLPPAPPIDPYGGIISPYGI